VSLVLNVEILGEFKKLTDATKGSEKQLTGLQKTASGISKKINGAFAAIGIGLSFTGIVRGIKSVSEAASDLSEAQNAVNVAFGDGAKELEEFSKSAAQNLGLSRKEILGISTQFSSFAKTIAGEGGNASKVVKDLAARGADFASVFNLNVSDALEKFQSGLAGQSEPLRKFGIDLSAATVQQYALENGIWDGTGAMTEQQKVMARYGALMEQTSMVQGDFANTANGLANTQRILKAEFENVKAEVGTALLPAMVTLFQAIRDNLPEIKTFIGELTKLVPVFIELVVFAVQYKELILGLAIAIGTLTTAVQVATVVANLFNASLLGPGILGAAVILGGIAAGMWQVYNNTRAANREIDEFNRLQNIERVTRTPSTPEQIAGEIYQGIIPQLLPPPVQPPVPAKQELSVSININRAQVSGQDIVNELNQVLKSRGLTRIAIK
jgi:hypothetical protein